MSPRESKKDQVAGYVRGLINSGELDSDGDDLLVPTEEDLIDRLSVARDTVRKGLEVLERESLIGPGSSGPGKRRKVLTRDLVEISLTKTEHMTRRLDRSRGVDAWNADLLDQGLVPGQSIAVEMVLPPPRVAALLHIAVDQPVTARRRVRTVNGKPHNLCTTYYPQFVVERCPRIQSPLDVPEGVIAYMAERGFVQVWDEDEFEARQADPDEVRLLNLRGGAVIEQYRTGYIKTDDPDSGLAPVKLTVTIWPGDRTKLKAGYPAS